MLALLVWAVLGVALGIGSGQAQQVNVGWENPALPAGVQVEFPCNKKVSSLSWYDENSLTLISNDQARAFQAFKNEIPEQYAPPIVGEFQAGSRELIIALWAWNRNGARCAYVVRIERAEGEKLKLRPPSSEDSWEKSATSAERAALAALIERCEKGPVFNPNFEFLCKQSELPDDPRFSIVHPKKSDLVVFDRETSVKSHIARIVVDVGKRIYLISLVYDRIFIKELT